MPELKRFTVIAGPDKSPVTHDNVTVNGITDDMPLSPTIARQVARVAVGHCRMVWISSPGDSHCYRLYGPAPGQQRRYPVGPRQPVGRPPGSTNRSKEEN